MDQTDEVGEAPGVAAAAAAAATAAAADSTANVQLYCAIFGPLAAQGLPPVQGAPLDQCMAQNGGWTMANSFLNIAVQQWPVDSQRALIGRCVGKAGRLRARVLLLPGVCKAQLPGASLLPHSSSQSRVRPLPPACAARSPGCCWR